MPRTVRSPYDDSKPWLDNARAEAVSSVVTFFNTRLVFDNDEILALLGGGTPQEILPAPGDGKAYCVFAVTLTADKTGGAYTYTGDALVQCHVTGGGVLAGGVFKEILADAYPLFASGNSERVTASLQGQWYDGGDGSLTTAFENKALKVSFWSLPTGVGGGHADNTLTVSVLYTVVDV